MLFWVLIAVAILVFLYFYFSSKQDKPGGTKQPATNIDQVHFLIIEDGEAIPSDTWYRKTKWLNPNLIAYRGIWDRDWKIATQLDVRVAGISIDNRQENFLKVMNAEGFHLSLEPEPDNPVNPKARKVLAHGRVNDQIVAYHIGYLPDEIANRYAGVELDIRPKSILLPDEDFENISVEITLLERSVAYLKKQHSTVLKSKK